MPCSESPGPVAPPSARAHFTRAREDTFRPPRCAPATLPVAFAPTKGSTRDWRLVAVLVYVSVAALTEHEDVILRLLAFATDEARLAIVCVFCRGTLPSEAGSVG